MKQSFLKLSTVLMLAFGCVNGAEETVTPIASNQQGLNRALLIQTTRERQKNFTEVRSIEVLGSIPLREALEKIFGVDGIQAPETSITILKFNPDNPDNSEVKLDQNELAALGFTENQDLGALRFSAFDTLGFNQDEKPLYCLSIPSEKYITINFFNNDRKLRVVASLNPYNKSMSLKSILIANGVGVTSENSVGVFKCTGRLNNEDLAILGFNPDKNLLETSLGKLGVLGPLGDDKIVYQFAITGPQPTLTPPLADDLSSKSMAVLRSNVQDGPTEKLFLARLH